MHRLAQATLRGRLAPCGHLLPMLPRSVRLMAETSGGASSSKAELPQAQAPSTETDKKEERKPMGWGLFFVYLSSGFGSLTFLYYFYKARYSFHQTEILMVDALRRLPFYWPPASRAGEMNSRTDAEGLPDDLKTAFCEWFVATDLEEPKGVTRDDVLELINELGYSEKAQPAKDFLYRGEGQIEEKRRMTCAGLQESLTLLCTLRRDAEALPKAEAKEGEEVAPPKPDTEALGILRRKVRRSSSMLNSAETLQAAMAGADAASFMGDFPRPRYLVVFAENASEDLTIHVKKWLTSAGLLVELDGLGAAMIKRPPFLVVSSDRESLELEAERLGYLKPHRALAPFIPGQGLGKIEFETRPEEWVRGYEGYERPDFWQPGERIQLLRHRLEQVPAPVEELRELQVSNPTALAVTESLLKALRIAGQLEALVPLDDDFGRERRAMWKEAIWMADSPVDRIEAYFGSEVALYFAWLNHFTYWLLAPAGVGLACFLRMHYFGYTVDDDPYMPFHSLFVVFWAACFVRCWDRFCAAKAWQWNVHGLDKRPDEHRPEFRGPLHTSRVTGQPERHYPYSKRLFAYLLSVLVTSLMLMIAFWVMICSLNLQGYMETNATSFEQVFYIAPLARLSHTGAIFDPHQTEYFGLLAFGPVALHVLAIMHLNKIYRFVAEWLTVNENHRLLEQHQSSLIAKRFLFDAFDCYISLFYVGFVQQDIRKLRQELICLYGVDSLRRVLLESIIPLVLEQISKRRISKKALELKRSEQAHFIEALEVLDQPLYEQFDDFLEMVIEFGYVTLFASAFPLAAALSVVSNMVELKSDMFKLAVVYQRPISHRVSSIGIWGQLLQIIMSISVLTNVMIFSMSEQLASWAPWLYKEASFEDVRAGRLASVLDAVTGTKDLVIREGAGRYVIFAAAVLEHIVGVAVFILMISIPCQPDWVTSEIQRTKHFQRTRAAAAGEEK
ncbi:unnamed protein product [Effrenium voratum]|uniref:Anoctamin transmembrane domain-containing protein n=1 Tax=Effrenium voratum TaxID=2562239 RepID=A0AA36NA83_9DINO|nr:unnamed protein product [Effrenium voratum]